MATNNKKTSLGRFLLPFLFAPILFCIAFFVAYALRDQSNLDKPETTYFPVNRREDDWKRASFMVAVISPNSAADVPLYISLTEISLTEERDFIKKYPDYSFLIPPDKLSFYKEEIKSPYFKYLDIEVEQISSGRQIIKLNAHDSDNPKDRHYITCYEATDKEIIPIMREDLRVSSDFIKEMDRILFGFFISVIVTILVTVLWILYLLRKVKFEKT